MIWSLAFVRSLSSRLVVWMNTGLPFTSCYRPILSEINPIKRVIVSCIFETQIHGRTCLSLCLQIWLSVARHSLYARMQTMIRLIPIDFFLDPIRSQACEERNGELCAHLWFFAVFRIEVVQIHFPLPTSHFSLLHANLDLLLLKNHQNLEFLSADSWTENLAVGHVRVCAFTPNFNRIVYASHDFLLVDCIHVRSPFHPFTASGKLSASNDNTKLMP